MASESQEPICIEHKIPLVLRTDMKNGTEELACVCCDIEALGPPVRIKEMTSSKGEEKPASPPKPQ